METIRGGLNMARKNSGGGGRIAITRAAAVGTAVLGPLSVTFQNGPIVAS